MTMAKTLYIIGAGGHGKVTAGCAQASEEYDQICFLDGYRSVGERIGDWPVVGKPEEFLSFNADASSFFVAIGDNHARKQWLNAVLNAQVNVATIVHPSSIIAEYVSVGEGSLLVAGTIINGFTEIGEGCIINTNTTVDHDCRIGDFVHIAPGCNLAGTVEVGELTFIGIGSAVIPNRKVGKQTVIGAGSTVIHDIESNVVAVGSPARCIKSNNSE